MTTLTNCPHCGGALDSKPEVGDRVGVIWPHEGRMNGYIRSIDWYDRDARVVVDDGRIIDVPLDNLRAPA